MPASFLIPTRRTAETMRVGSRPLPSTASMFVIAALTAASVAHAEDSVQHWLDRMARAVETLNYRGTLVHLRNGHVDTLRIIHRSDEDGIRERIYSLDGEPREVLRNGNNVRCLLPGDKPLLLESQLAGRLLPSMPVHRLTNSQSAYRLTLDGHERVAGMKTQIVRIEPRDKFRYGYRLWLEEQTGMLLRYALTDRDGQQLQRMSFASIELGVHITDAELRPDMDGAPRILTTTLDEERSPVGAMARRAAMIPNVPAGFRLANAGHGLGENGEVFEHLLFSDGLASFSVYIEDAADGGVASRMESMGQVHVYTAQTGGRLVTVVGEVPADTVELVGRQLRRSGGSGAHPHR